MPPDVTASTFWLKNRDPENWRDVQNVDQVLGKPEACGWECIGRTPRRRALL
jgi:hypothetical protein